eukprot:42433-Eustigmatos_ZCMA.PRE.1
MVVADEEMDGLAAELDEACTIAELIGELFVFARVSCAMYTCRLRVCSLAGPVSVARQLRVQDAWEG